MIAFLCTSLRSGAVVFGSSAMFEGYYLRNDNRVVTKSGVDVGFLGSQGNHLRGKKLTGFILLDNVPTELVAMAIGRVRKGVDGNQWRAPNAFPFAKGC